VIIIENGYFLEEETIEFFKVKVHFFVFNQRINIWYVANLENMSFRDKFDFFQEKIWKRVIWGGNMLASLGLETSCVTESWW